MVCRISFLPQARCTKLVHEWVVDTPETWTCVTLHLGLPAAVLQEAEAGKAEAERLLDIGKVRGDQWFNYALGNDLLIVGRGKKLLATTFKKMHDAGEAGCIQC